jgi:hypothetical protein
VYAETRRARASFLARASRLRAAARLFERAEGHRAPGAETAERPRRLRNLHAERLASEAALVAEAAP